MNITNQNLPEVTINVLIILELGWSLETKVDGIIRRKNPDSHKFCFLFGTCSFTILTPPSQPFLISCWFNINVSNYMHTREMLSTSETTNCSSTLQRILTEPQTYFCSHNSHLCPYSLTTTPPHVIRFEGFCLTDRPLHNVRKCN